MARAAPDSGTVSATMGSSVGRREYSRRCDVFRPTFIFMDRVIRPGQRAFDPGRLELGFSPPAEQVSG